MKTLSQSENVIIVGGSLAGLMHARTLLASPSPPTVRILERSPTALLHNQGAGIIAGNETQQFFEEYVKPGKEIAITSPMRHYLDRYGKVMPETVNPWQQRMTSWDLVYYLLRWRVDGLQSEYIKGLHEDDRPKAQYDNGCLVTALEKYGNRLRLTWTHKDHGEQSAEADMIIAADGASSTIRKLLEPQIVRKYVNYVAWRGTCPEDQLSDSARAVFVEKFTFFHSIGIQVLGYMIPGQNGTLEKGKRLFNWLWYSNYEDGSPELDELMTDIHGKRHKITLPVGTIQPQVWEKQKAAAKELLPPQFAEVIGKTKQPFIQAITDVISPHNRFMDGKVILVGDALAGFRPHTAASTGQAAHDALRLGEWLRGEISSDEYDERVMEFARRIQQHGVNLGERSQFGRHPHNG